MWGHKGGFNVMGDMSYRLNSLKRVIERILQGRVIGFFRGY